MNQLDGYGLAVVYWLVANADENYSLTLTLDRMVEELGFPKKVIRNRLLKLEKGHAIGHAKGHNGMTITIIDCSCFRLPQAKWAQQRARKRAQPNTKNQVEMPLPIVIQSIVDEVEHETPVPKQTAGSYAFECYSRHYENKYQVKPLRDRMANVHAKSIAESVPREDVDAFFQSYLSNPAAYYVMKAHPLSLARVDVQKIYTELSTGMRLSSHLSRQYETATENQEAAKRYMERKYGSGFSAKP